MSDPYSGAADSRGHKTQYNWRGNGHIADDSASGICRICRGEGSSEEPLFYPCKCSGSIQHVHQDCLMEWLSHSQKKYCELCKTSFRFTKFYDPNMPSSLPLAVFLRQSIRYFVQSALGYLRTIVAISFWASWLPWFMRRGWSLMFWVSQESWGVSTSQAATPSASTAVPFSMESLDTCPSSPLFAIEPTPITPIPSIENGLSWWENQSLTSFLLRCLMRIFGLPVPPLPSSKRGLYWTSANETQSLLSGVKFLRNFTRSSSINQTIIAVFEGQLITALVIVSFILIIILRDYVVQQQPEINARAPDFDHIDAVQDAVAIEAEVLDPEIGGGNGDDELSDIEMTRSDDEDSLPCLIPDEQGDTNHSQQTAVNDSDSNNDEDTDAATGSQTRQNPSDESNDRSDVENGLEDPQLTSFTFHHSPSQASALSDWETSSDSEFTPEMSDRSQSADSVRSGTAKEKKGKERADAVFSIEIPTDEWFQELESGPSRPRSISDGPQIQRSLYPQAQASTHPLANNTWSFNAIPTEYPNDEDFDEKNVVTPSVDPNRDSRSLDEPMLDESRLSRERPDATQYPDEQDGNSYPPLLEVEEHTARISPGPASPPAPQTKHQNGSRWFVDKVAAFMWDDVEESESESESPYALDPADEDAVVVRRLIGAVNEANDEIENIGQDRVLPAGGDIIIDGADVPGVPGGMDPEAIEDMEDFEGIMELLGMRGPITNLFQNVVFCAVLVQSALAVFVLSPFTIGRFTIWFLAKPLRLGRFAFELSKMLQDLVFLLTGFLSWVVFYLIAIFTSLSNSAIAAQIKDARSAAWVFFMAAGSRVAHFFALDVTDNTGMQYWSAVSRQALIEIKADIWAFFSALSSGISTLFAIRNPFLFVTVVAKSVWGCFSRLPNLLQPAGVTDFPPENVYSVDLRLAYWSASDITWAILAGYVTIFVIAALYVKSGIRLARGTVFEEAEASLIETCHQASGILKVITIVSIEMLAFPLYCGLLLDLAVLPLFSGATVRSRLLFTYNNPLTSIFVYWFVGTGYMFHFALFVSMCRKIMRPGVLYFIRDPDDPEFHPVRDVLERNLTTQLRKILFSAFVYGTMVIVCLGGVVWGLALAAPSVLPIHFSSNEPILQFPVDLLFYNFFMPLAFRHFKPGDRLQDMYTWCFRKSARILRLTYFLFGERRIDEEGILQLTNDSVNHKNSLWRHFLLGLDHEERKVIQKPWKEILDGVWPSSKLDKLNMKELNKKKAHLVKSGQLIKDGRFVRAPASDRVKIPKGRKAFIDVNERDRRADGLPERDLYATSQFRMVYLPPNLLTRVFLFILCVWSFAAITGVGLTVIPLILGRKVFKIIIPSHVHTNDIYAFCIGIHILGAIVYCAYRIREHWADTKQWVSNYTNSQFTALRDLAQGFATCAKIIYAYSMIFVACPLAMAILVELYIALPAHTYLNAPSKAVLEDSAKIGKNTGHDIRIIEAWTLGLLYMKLAVRLAESLLPNTRFVAAMRAILARGWLNPNIRTLTKGFVIPGFMTLTVALFGPPSAVRVIELMNGVTSADYVGMDAMNRVRRYRQSYPALLLVGFILRYSVILRRGFDTLKIRIRDDSYLMGERLQNYDGSLAKAWVSTRV